MQSDVAIIWGWNKEIVLQESVETKKAQICFTKISKSAKYTGFIDFFKLFV